jgi:NTP pyrophosphatase (non-canonical NTP hydrolase)
MEPAVYQRETRRTHKAEMLSLEFMLQGALGEAGELLNLDKKRRYHNDDRIDDGHEANELGDVTWYIAGAFDMLGLELEVQGHYPGDKHRAYQLLAVHLGLALSAGLHYTTFKLEAQRDAVRDHLRKAVYFAAGASMHLQDPTGYALGLEAIFDLNIAKLRARYPDGYSDAASKARVDVKAERIAELEKLCDTLESEALGYAETAGKEKNRADELAARVAELESAIAKAPAAKGK